MRMLQALAAGMLACTALVACAQTPTPVVLSAREATQTALPALPGPPAADPGPAALRLGVAAFDGFDPLSIPDEGTEQVQALVYETLLAYDVQGGLFPLLAADMPLPSDDALSWSVTLRDGVTFHDGSPLDGNSAVAALEAVLAGQDAGRGSLAVLEFRRVVESVSADGHTLTLRLREPYPALPQLLAEQALTITHGAGVGTGPFVLERADEPDAGLTLVANQGYHGGPPLLSGVRVRNFAGSEHPALAIIEALRRGDLDLAALRGPLPDDLAQVAQSQAGPGRQVWLIFNRAVPPVDRAGVRLGLGMALDRRLLAEADSSWAFVSVATPPQGAERRGVLEQLAGAGLPDGFDLDLWYTVSDQVAERLRQQWAEAAHVEVALHAATGVELSSGLAGVDGQALSSPAGAFLVSWARGWEGERWLALAGWGGPGPAALEAEALALLLYSGAPAFVYRAGLEGLGVTAGGWPRVTAQTALP